MKIYVTQTEMLKKKKKKEEILLKLLSTLCSVAHSLKIHLMFFPDVLATDD